MSEVVLENSRAHRLLSGMSEIAAGLPTARVSWSRALRLGRRARPASMPAGEACALAIAQNSWNRRILVPQFSPDAASRRNGRKTYSTQSLRNLLP